MTEELKNWYAEEKLSLIGGFQDQKDTLQLLFFKQDRLKSTDLEIFIEQTEGDIQENDIEKFILQNHMDMNGILKEVISTGSNPGMHQFIFEQ